MELLEIEIINENFNGGITIAAYYTVEHKNSEGGEDEASFLCFQLDCDKVSPFLFSFHHSQDGDEFEEVSWAELMEMAREWGIEPERIIMAARRIFFALLGIWRNYILLREEPIRIVGGDENGH